MPAAHIIRLMIDEAAATVTVDRPQNRKAVTGQMVTARPSATSGS